MKVSRNKPSLIELKAEGLTVDDRRQPGVRRLTRGALTT